VQVLLATENAGKLKEFRSLFAATQHSLVSLAEFSVQQADETGQTFVENALLKARNASAATGLPCLADDSGLSVQALDGRPGIYSARYAANDPINSEQADLSQDEANNAKLLREMAAQTDRRAHFYCALVLLRHAKDPAPLIATGQWHGNIGTAPAGRKGFGYDPLFIDETSGKTAASLTAEEKHARSHRGLAWKVLAPQLTNL